jgi:Zn-dependent protease
VIRAIRQKLVAFGNPNRGFLFTVFGLPVRIHPSFWLVVLLIGVQRRPHFAALIEWVLVVLVSILVHEFGHGLTAARWGVVYRITVHGAGGETTWKPTGEPVWWRAVLVSLAGPIAGFSLALLAWLILPSFGGNWVMEATARDLLQVNVAWGVFNLLPIAPLDGGQALKAWLVKFWYQRGEWVCAGIGVVTAIVALIAAILAEQGWAALVVGIFGIHNALAFRSHYEAYRDAHTRTGWQRLSGRDRVRERY